MIGQMELQKGVEAFEEALKYAALASTREDLVYVEENYWIAFHRLRESNIEEHRLICTRCLEAIARILDGEDRRDAANSLRQEAQTFRRPADTMADTSRTGKE